MSVHTESKCVYVCVSHELEERTKASKPRRAAKRVIERQGNDIDSKINTFSIQKARDMHVLVPHGMQHTTSIHVPQHADKQGHVSFEMTSEKP